MTNKSFRNQQNVYVLGNGKNLLNKGMIIKGKIVAFSNCAMPLTWYFDEGDDFDSLFRVYFPSHTVFGNFYSKHIFLTEKEAKSAGAEL